MFEYPHATHLLNSIGAKGFIDGFNLDWTGKSVGRGVDIWGSVFYPSVDPYSLRHGACSCFSSLHYAKHVATFSIHRLGILTW